MKHNDTLPKITRRRFIAQGAAVGALGVSLFGCDPEANGDAADAGSEPPPPKPNIVYIFTDQHRGDALGAMGHPVVQTPNLDRVAGNGVLFGRCHSNGPLCRPGRASMMSGRYPHQHRVWHNDEVMGSNGASHVRRIRDEAGYHTALIGKSHLHQGTGHLDNHKDKLERFGFEYVHELIGPGQSTLIEPVNQTAYTDWLTASTPPGETDKYERLADYLMACVPNGPQQWLNPTPDEAPWSLSTDDHMDRYTGRVAADWIRNYSGDRPFYLQVLFPGPHGLFDATKEYRNLYDPDDPRMPAAILEPIGEDTSKLTARSRSFLDITGISAAEQRKLQAAYYADLSLVDAGIGDVVDALEETGLLDNTWVVYCSDHGEQLGDHVLVQKSVFYEQSVHVPLIMRPPGGTIPWRSEALVDQIDATASILDIAGLERDGEQGRSLVKQTTLGPDDPDAHVGKPWILSEIYRMGMLRTEKYKLVINYIERKPVELFDLENDPRELKNLVSDPAHADVVAELYGTVADFLAGKMDISPMA